MLVISRKAGETLLIGENIEITVLEAVGDKIKLGITAPRDVKIIRSELKETEKINKEAASDKLDAESLNRKFKNLSSQH